MTIPILMYHHVLPKSGFITSSVCEFESQIRYLSKNGYKAITSNEFYLYKKGEITLPKKSILITFDDGWRDNFYYAYPILKKYDLKATLFLVSGWIEAASNQNSINKTDFLPLSHKEAKKAAPKNPAALFLNWDEVEKMSDVFDFRSHTHGHFDNYFKKNSLEDEIVLCKEVFKKRLGFDDNQLCWPRGKFDDSYINIAKDNGYEMFYTTQRGINLSDKKLEHIKRIAVKKDEAWLKKTLFIFSNAFLGKIYSSLKK
ncbi:polysaccharide deacetylase [Campylobacter ureolyticus RIGS 9880]|uniref:Polysaccharide deacetylase n=1 Tax=Campylobacter ureolyticus RIGS 9880 TaxID=1032069 RepID=A0AAU8U171_9BACT|nr:polysaccharide deacetylase family protein [Campylobacter ureolyticus]AKT90943.1 polysaccharide deacetylase [Campylobacter ureolyticus RIGS 9880]